MSSLRTNVADLLHHPGSRRAFTADEVLANLHSGDVRVDERVPVHIELHLERVSEGIVVRGHISGRWDAECSRCLNAISRDFDVSVQELYEPEPVDGETYPLEGDELDLELLVRDAVVLELPVAPLCIPDCAGLCPVCGIDRNRDTCTCDTSVRDPRWDALNDLKIS